MVLSIFLLSGFVILLLAIFSDKPSINFFFSFSDEIFDMQYLIKSSRISISILLKLLFLQQE